jgi:hypothetical protein
METERPDDVEDLEAAVGEAADRADAELDDLEQRNRDLGEHADETRKDWERKQADSGVPGAQPKDE